MCNQLRRNLKAKVKINHEAKENNHKVFKF
jgi:hypothetical protein